MDIKKIRRGLKARTKGVDGSEDLTYYLIRNFEASKELLLNYFEYNPVKPKPEGLIDADSEDIGSHN